MGVEGYEVKRGTEDTREKLIKSSNEVFLDSGADFFGVIDAFSNENIHNTYYIEESGVSVSQASIFESKCFLNGISLSVASLGSVLTLEKYRHKGLSTKIIKNIMKDKSSEGKSLMLVSGEIELYTKLKCAKVGTVFSATVNSGKLPDKFKVVRVTRTIMKEHINEYHTLHSSEPYRFLRTPDLSNTIFNEVLLQQKSHIMEMFEIYIKHKIVAYIVVHSYEDIKKGRVVEYAGSRYGIIFSLSGIASWMEWDSIDININPQDVTTKSLLESLNVAMREGFSQGTMIILNPGQLITEINPLILEKTGSEILLSEESEEEWTIIHRGRSITVEGKDKLTELFFGHGKGSFNIPLMFTDDLNYI